MVMRFDTVAEMSALASILEADRASAKRGKRENRVHAGGEKARLRSHWFMVGRGSAPPPATRCAHGEVAHARPTIHVSAHDVWSDKQREDAVGVASTARAYERHNAVVVWPRSAVNGTLQRPIGHLLARKDGTADCFIVRS